MGESISRGGDKSKLAVAAGVGGAVVAATGVLSSADAKVVGESQSAMQPASGTVASVVESVGHSSGHAATGSSVPVGSELNGADSQVSIEHLVDAFLNESASDAVAHEALSGVDLQGLLPDDGQLQALVSGAGVQVAALGPTGGVIVGGAEIGIPALIAGVVGGGLVINEVVNNSNGTV